MLIILLVLVKKHKKLFNDVLKQIISVNKVPMHNNKLIIDDECKTTHKKLFNDMLKELISNNKVHMQNKINYEAGNKGSSANIIDNQYEIDSMHNSLLNNYISYYFNKIKKIEKGLSEHNKNITSSLSKIYSDDRTILNQLKKINGKVNILLDHICLFIFHKERANKSIIENTKVSGYIKNCSKINNIKFVFLVNIEDYLSDSVNNIHDGIKKKKNQDVLDDFILTRKHTLKSFNSMRDNSTKKKKH